MRQGEAAEHFALVLKGEATVERGDATGRQELVGGLQRLSDESRRLRFFSGGMIPSGLIDYLVDIAAARRHREAPSRPYV